MTENREPGQIQQMVEMVQKIAAGDFAARLVVDESWGTLEALAIGLNMLGEDIEDRGAQQEAQSQESEKQRRAILNILQDVAIAKGKLEQEVAERKAIEKALRKSEAQLSNAMDIARLGAWEYDVESDLFTFNDHFYAIFHTTAQEVGGYTMASADYARRFVHPDDMGLVGEEVRKAIETPDPDYSRQLEHRVIFADGQPGHISVRFYIEKDDQGRTIRTYGANQDITERKRAELALEEANTELDTFVRTASHDLRSPLVSLTGFLALLKDTEGENLTEAGQRYLGRIESNAQRMECLLDDLLKLSRAGRDMAPRQKVNLTTMMDFIRSDFKPLMEAKGALLTLPGELPVIFGETSAISQIFTNLISNALKYMGDEPEPRVELAWRTEGENHHFTITDNGIGIDPAYHEKIFESFETLKDERAGEVDASGVGLNIVKRVIERHNGRVWVESDGRKGSVFHFTLPALVPEPERSQNDDPKETENDAIDKVGESDE